MMDGRPIDTSAVRLPACLQYLAYERRWVGWQWDQVADRWTKPPRRIVDGRAADRARNNRPEDWVTLEDARTAVERHGLAGVGLQLLDLEGFAAIDLDDVREPVSGALLAWASALVETCASYAEVTPSGEGLRILGAVCAAFPSTHTTERRHPEGGKFEVYANTQTGRFITVTGDRLDHAPDRLARIDDPLRELLEFKGAGIPAEVSKPSLAATAGHRVPSVTSMGAALAFANLPDWLRMTIARGGTGDRSVDFQAAVNGLHARVDKATAFSIISAHPDGPAQKYHDRLEAEFVRSWHKAGVSQKTTSGRRLADGDIPPSASDAACGDAPGSGAEPTEDGVAAALVGRHGSDLRFDHDTGLWHVWDGARWLPDTTQGTLNRIRLIAREASASLTERQRAAVRRASFATGASRLAAADPAVSVRQEAWDHDPMLLGIPDGVIDLRTGVVGGADRKQMITRQAATAPVEEAGCPRWHAFLDELTGGDAELAAYLRRLAGYLLTGSTREHVLVFLYGPGGNGKSVFVNTLVRVLGDYAATAPMDTFTASRTDRHPTELAMLRGVRLVTASETEEGRSWAESRIKQLTGGDPVTARFMRRDFFTYRPQFKLVLVGNHKPMLRNVDEAARRRFHIVPFVHCPASPDKRLEEKLETEAPGILAWAIDGCLEWQAAGLAPPTAVRAETETYFDHQDLLGQWLADACLAEPGNPRCWASIAQLYRSWCAYAEAVGEAPGSQKKFGAGLERRGFPPDRRKLAGQVVRVRLGIALAEGRDLGAEGDA